MDVAPQKQVKRIIKTVPDIDWVEIPAGEFIFLGNDVKEDLPLNAYHISRYPITNFQYQCFIDEGGYKNEQWWKEFIKTKPEKSAWWNANRPKTNVNWYEAMAFCRWLSAQLKYEITLPTEKQWEKAAKGVDGREYPWGYGYKKGYANVSEPAESDSIFMKTCAVGLFPKDKSPYGVSDITGNVSDWCLDGILSEKFIQSTQNNNNRIIRGGAWIDVPEFTRSSIRSENAPGYRDNSIGFRVCCFSPKPPIAERA